jgi:beta-aspartyl-peptidase (threonine type)
LQLLLPGTAPGGTAKAVWHGASLMKSLIFRRNLVLGACLLLACSGRAAAQEAEQAIRAVLDDQMTAWNNRDLVRFMKGYWQSEQLSFFSGNAKTAGWQATLERYQKRYQGEGKEMGRLAFTELSVELLGPDHALVRGRFRLQLKNDAPTGIFTLILRRTSAGWRIIHDHTSS